MMMVNSSPTTVQNIDAININSNSSVVLKTVTVYPLFNNSSLEQ